MTALFRVKSTVDDFVFGGRRFDGVPIKWFVHKRDTPIGDYRTLIAEYDEAVAEVRRRIPPEYADQAAEEVHEHADEYFAADEAAALAAYLREAHDDGSVRVEEVALPLRTFRDEGGRRIDMMPTGAISVGGGTDFYMLDRRDDYELPIGVWGYFRLPVGYCMSFDAATGKLSKRAWEDGVTTPIEEASE